MFRDIVVKRDIPDRCLEEEFSFQTVFNVSSNSYCCCSCAFVHEYFDYISETGDIHEEMLGITVQNIKNGHCPHTSSFPSDLTRTTRVYGSHIVAALGSEDLVKEVFFREKVKTTTVYDPCRLVFLGSEDVVKTLYARKQEVETDKGVFGLTPFQNAVLKQKSTKVLAAVLPFQHVASWAEKAPYLTWCKETNDLQVNLIPLFELLVKQRNVTTLKWVLTSLKPPRASSDWIAASELIFKHNLIDMLGLMLQEFSKVLKKRAWNKALNKLMSLEYYHSVAELAILCNQKDVLEQSFQLLNEKQDDRKFVLRLVKVSCILQRSECTDFLTKQGVPIHLASVNKLSFAQMECLLHLLHRYKHFREEIKTAVNVKIANSHNALSNLYHWTSHPPLTPLQFYVFEYSDWADIQVVKTMIDLGADIDKFNLDGNTLLEVLLKHVIGYIRGMLELLLYENTSIASNDSAVALGLKNSKYVDVDWDRRSKSLQEQIQQRQMIPGRYLLDSEIHDHSLVGKYEDESSALKFTAPLLIESGFPYCRATIEDALEDSDVIKHLSFKNYLENCLSTPRSLKICCRDSLRKHFERRQIHTFVRAIHIPETLKDFILLKNILHTEHVFSVLSTVE